MLRVGTADLGTGLGGVGMTGNRDMLMRLLSQSQVVHTPSGTAPAACEGGSAEAKVLAELTAEASHELRNALAAIGHQTELLQAELPASIGPERAELILKTVDAAANIVRRLQQAVCPPDRQEEAVDVNQLLLDVAELTRFRWARPHGDPRPQVAVQVDLREVPSVRGHPGELLQVFCNLVINACEALTEGGTIRLRSRSSGTHVLVAVSDDGPGMTEETRQAIFQRSFSTKQGENSGLGLSIVADIVRRHGGHVLVNSQPGSGTTFYVSLRAMERAASGEEEKAKSAPRRVLVVEDEETIRECVRQFLEFGGYEVTCVESGEAAVTQLERGFELLLTDLSLGGINGYEVARLFKQANPEGKAMMLTGWQGAERGNGAVDVVLSKPTPGRKILDVARELLEGRAEELLAG